MNFKFEERARTPVTFEVDGSRQSVEKTCDIFFYTHTHTAQLVTYQDCWNSRLGV